MSDTYRDQIVRYLISVNAGVMMFCTSCGRTGRVWVGITEGNEVLTCCGTCQRVLKREPTGKGGMPQVPQPNGTGGCR